MSAIFTAIWAFILGVINIGLALWFSASEMLRALITAIVLFAVFLFLTRNVRRRIYDEIDAKDAARKANGTTKDW